MCGHSVLQYFLEIIGIVVIEEPAAHQEPGVVIDDYDSIDPPAPAALHDIRKIACIRLPHLPKGTFLSRRLGVRADLRSWFFTKRWTAQTLTAAGMNAVSTRCL